MIRHKDIENLSIKNPVVTIGFFDGVHLGHRFILNELKEEARRLNGESVVITFWPHPRIVLKTGKEDFRLLNTIEEKASILEAAGLGHLVVIPFTKSFSQLSMDDFVKEILVEKIGIRCLLVGFNQKLGHNREGDFVKLKVSAKKFGFEIKKIQAYPLDNGNVSSSKIRKLLLSGDVERANRMLGWKYSLSGEVIGGSRLGTSIGFPTANIIPGEDYKLLPADGVYAVFTRLKGCSWMGMMNIGSRPTVNKDPGKKTMEVHLLDFRDNIYSEQIRIEFVSRIRDEKKFPDIDSLRSQLITDREKTLKILRDAGRDNSL